MGSIYYMHGSIDNRRGSALLYGSNLSDILKLYFIILMNISDPDRC